MSFSATTQCTEKTCSVAQRSKDHKAARTGKFCWSGRFRIITASSLPGRAETRREPLAFFVSGAGDNGVQEQGKV